MKISWLLLACLLPSMCFAQTTIKYDLAGNYIFASSVTRSSSWFAKSECVTYHGDIAVANGGGSIEYIKTVYGTLSFNGSGVAGATMTTLSIFDKTKSDATVQITWSTDGNCIPTVNNGYAVFDAPTGQSQSGTYSINSTTGTGTITLSGSRWGQFQTTGSFASCASGGAIYVIPNTILVETVAQTTPPTPNLYGGSGIAEHANGVLLACP